MSQHTPGPWVVWAMEDGTDGITAAGADGILLTVARVHDQDVKRQGANARLIAAAPEMFEYLCNLARVWAMSQGENATLDILRTLLAKIHGPKEKRRG